MGILKPGDPGVPQPDLPLTADETQVATLGDPVEPTDADIPGEDYSGPLEDFDDESVASALDDAAAGDTEDLS